MQPISSDSTQKCSDHDSETRLKTTPNSTYSFPEEHTKTNEIQSSFKQRERSNESHCEYKKVSELNFNLQHEEKLDVQLTTSKGFQVGNNNIEEGTGKNGLAEKVFISCEGLNVEINFETPDNIYVNDIGSLHLKYSFKISGQEDYQFCIKNLKTGEESSYKKIIGEGSLLLEFPENEFQKHSQSSCSNFPDYQNEETISSSSSKEVVSDYSEVESKDSCETIEIILKSDETSENSELSYRSVDLQEDRVVINKLCSNCNQNIQEEIVYHCLFGHDSCKNCKGKPCILCQKIMGESKSYCKNHHKGCSNLQLQEQLTKHEIDCEFNDFRCPFPRCVFLNTLTDLKQHFLVSHNKSLIQSNTILEVLNGRKDRKWYLYCFESLFVCSYYYYGTHVEFILRYIGANDKAKCFRLEVEIKTMKEKKLAKRALCAGWNDSSLCKGVCYDYEDVSNCDSSRFQFTANLKIVNIGDNRIYTSE